MSKKKNLFTLVFILLSSVSCMRIKNPSDFFSKNMVSAYYQLNVLDKSNAAMDFHIQFKMPLPSEINIEAIYFKDQKSKKISVDKLTVLGYFSGESHKKDFVLDADPKKEYGNSLPITLVRGMDIAPNEALLECKIGDKKYFYKIPSVQKKE